MQSTPPADKSSVLRTMQIIAGAMIVGVLFIGALAAFLSLGVEADAERPPFLSNIAAGLALLALVVCVMVPINVSATAQEDPASPARELAFYTAYQSRMVMRFAFLEGAAMLNLAAAIVDKQQYSLVIAGLIVLVMAAMFPTRGRVEAFMRSQTELSELPHGRGER